MSKIKKQSSYQKLNKRYSNLWRLYCRSQKRLENLGQGIEGDDILTPETALF